MTIAATPTTESESAERSLVAVAMLKVKYDRKSQDYLDYLRSYVAQVLPAVGERVTSDEVAGKLQQEFALSIPLQVVERSLRRFEKEKALRRIDGSFFVEKDVRDQSFDERRDQSRVELFEVVQDFRKHCIDRFANNLTEDDAFVSLMGFVRKFAVECLRTFVYSSPLPEVQSNAATDTWAASFINEAANAQGRTWLRIKTLFEGVLLANAFTSPDADLATSNFKGVTFYLDTPMVLSLLGFHGQHEFQKCEELLTQVRELHGSMMVFGHTIDETSAVLKYAEGHLEDQAVSNRVIRTLRESRRSKSDVALSAARIEESLSALKIRVRETPVYDVRYQIDEAALEGCLDQDIGHINPKALLHDINSIRSIYVLRAGVVPARLEQSRAAFVTPNSSLARAADNYSRRFEFTRDVSPVVTDYSLANLCWLKRPASAKHLVTLELLASTVAALKPDDREWSACLRECEKLQREGRVSSDQVALVRETLEAQDDYMTLTRGAGVELSPQVALELVRRAEERVAAPYVAQVAESQRRVLEAESARAQTEGRIDAISSGLSRASLVLILGTVIAGSFFGLRATLSGPPLGLSPLWQQVVVVCTTLLFAALTWFGWSRKDLDSRIAGLIGKAIRSMLAL